jgi:hypothetical protein
MGLLILKKGAPKSYILSRKNTVMTALECAIESKANTKGEIYISLFTLLEVKVAGLFFVPG